MGVANYGGQLQVSRRMASDTGGMKKVVNPSLKPEVSARIVDFMRVHCTAEQWGQ